MRFLAMPAALLLILLGAGASLQARSVQTWSYEDLVKASDLAAILEPVSTEPTQDIFPGPLHGEAKSDFVGQVTTFKVLATLKGKTESQIKVLHFAYSSDKLVIVNGARFAQFVSGPLQFKKQVLQNRQEIGGVAEQPVWLAFLKKMEDGRLEPVTPHYDSTDSFRELHRASFFTS